MATRSPNGFEKPGVGMPGPRRGELLPIIVVLIILAALYVVLA